ncbi:amidoligase family protein (plasmid) [Embleya sp. MST-111070]
MGQPLDAVRAMVTDEQDVVCAVRGHVMGSGILDGGVDGEVRVSRGSDGLLVVATDDLRCLHELPHDESYIAGRCAHEVAVGRALQDRLNAMEPTAADRLAAQTVLDEVAVQHAASEAAQEQARTAHAGQVHAVSYSEDFEAFQAVYRQARERQRAGEPPVPFITADATGGLGAREGGRAFGVEIEFDFPTEMSAADRAAATTAMASDLHNAGIASDPHLHGYHASRRNGYTEAANAWRMEYDSTVAGEIVSPILYDDMATWTNLRDVCAIVRRHGGLANARTGGHVHVGVADFDHTVEVHNRLIETVNAYEDVIYRLAQNPASARHRGLEWCYPNRIPTSPYTSVGAVREYNRSHHYALNFESVTGRGSDHAEFRMWDGSLDPGVIQAQVNLSLGLANTALREAGVSSRQMAQAVGSHRGALVRQGLWGRRLTGEPWRQATASFRGLVDRVFTREENRAQAVALFAATRWQERL